MKRKIITMLLFLALLITPLTVKAEKITVEEFIASHKTEVVKIAKEKDLFASVMMAQAILESGSGNSQLAKTYNNYFGMKGSGVTLATVEFDTINTNASFQVFDNPIDSFRAYAENFYKNDKIYGKFLTATDPIDAVKALDGVYATTSDYSSQLISLMDTYDLYKLDDEVKKLIEEENKKNEELEKKNILLKSYQSTNSMIKAKTTSIARRLYKKELKEMSSGLLDSPLYLPQYSGSYYNIYDIARLYNKSLEEARILYNSYKSESIDSVYGGADLPEGSVKALSFNKYLAQLSDTKKSDK